MKCARLQLQERAKLVVKRPSHSSGKPRRYCQRRLVHPEASEDPRFTCKPFICFEEESPKMYTKYQPEEDLVLTVQNLQFGGDTREQKRPRTSFKYKSLTDNRSHRMFVKEIVEETPTNFEDDLSSDLTSNYFDDYVKYILSNDRSRPSSSKSSIFLQDLRNTFLNEPINEKTVKKETKTFSKNDMNNKTSPAKVIKLDEKEEKLIDCHNINEVKLSYHKVGKRKSLTISRAPSPETIQVIRVDVVCNYSSSSITAECEDKMSKSDMIRLTDTEMENINLRVPHFADKYLLKSTVKSVDENLSCGSKVTLMCKTFKLSDRGSSSKRKNIKT